MAHYVCAGTCGGVAPQEKNCGSKTCTMFGEPLIVCDYKDGKHAGVRQEEKLEEEIEEAAGE